ncbi:MAG: hypothetical protein MI806_13615 [Minwuiales bacterium]|nr:hypothetical protein [Minwuiales bacterium]
MRIWPLFTVLVIAAGCAPNFQEACARAGFQPGTSAYADCVAEKEAEMAAWREEALKFRNYNGGGGV